MYRRDSATEVAEDVDVEGIVQIFLVLSSAACALVHLALHDYEARHAGHHHLGGDGGSEGRQGGAAHAAQGHGSAKAEAASEPAGAELKARFRRFAAKYLVVFLLATSADWMMGAYIYVLYQSYGYGIASIGRLFVVGFASSAVFGTVLGSLADSSGRKLASLGFCVVYALACLCKNYESYNILALGRVFGGVATSLLYTTFEAWCVRAYADTGLPPSWLGPLFAMATSSNAMVAVAAGLASNHLADVYGYVAPFNAALVPLALCAVAMALAWEENYGDRKSSPGVSLAAALRTIREDRAVLLVGLVCALFESAMYIFIFIWSPSLEARAGGQEVSFGLIFAVFMIWKVNGTALFRFSCYFMSVEALACFVFALAGVCFLVPIVSSSFGLCMASFCAYELCVGVYWPVIGTLRAKYIQEEVRATMTSVYRIPLNVIVITSLLNIAAMREAAVYLVCVVEMGLALACQRALARRP